MISLFYQVSYEMIPHSEILQMNFKLTCILNIFIHRWIESGIILNTFGNTKYKTDLYQIYNNQYVQKNINLINNIIFLI